MLRAVLLGESSALGEDEANGVRAGKLGDEQRAAVAAADGCAESLAGADQHSVEPQAVSLHSVGCSGR